MENWIHHVVAAAGVWAYVIIGLAVFLECALLVGLVVPGETLAIVGGFLAARGNLSLWVVLAVVAGSATLGDNVGFEMGRHLGREWLLKTGRHLRLKPEAVARVEHLFKRHGGAAVMIARFLAFARAIAPYVAGMSGVRYRVFVPYNALGAALFALGSVFVGYGFAAVWDTAHHWVTGVTLGAGAAVVVAGYIWWRHGRKGRHKSTSRRRSRTSRAKK